MWEILEHRRTWKQLDRLPVDILKRYEKWKDILRLSGPSGLRQIKGFNDEALRGEWRGHRSSRLSRQYRVIYRIERDKVLVEVVSVTAHDYHKK
jgi:addiction module RelE/StbE family toxin